MPDGHAQPREAGEGFVTGVSRPVQEDEAALDEAKATLHDWAKAGKVDRAEQAVRKGAALDAKDEAGMT
jgi:hypothetical protein